MSLTTINDLSYKIDGDNITLEQGQIESSCVVLHRIHLQHIAGALGIPVLDASAKAIKRRFEIVKERLIDLAAAPHYREEIVERCGSGVEFIIELDAICDLAAEFLNDLSEQSAMPTVAKSATVANTAPVQKSLV